MLLLSDNAIFISPRAQCVWASAVQNMLDHFGWNISVLGPMAAEFLADGTAVRYRVGPGGVTVSLQIAEGTGARDGWPDGLRQAAYGCVAPWRYRS